MALSASIRRRVLAFSVVAATLAWAPAHAHQSKIHRSALIERDGTGLVVLYVLEVRGRERQQKLRALYDENRDGKLVGRERAALERMLAERAMDGIQLVAAGAGESPTVLRLDSADTKLRIGAAGPERLMVLGRIANTPANFEIHASSRADHFALELRPGPGRTVEASRGRLSAGRLHHEMKGGERLKIHFSR